MDINYYTIIGNDELQILSKNTLDRAGINYIVSEDTKSKSSITFIHLDNAGEKVMFSYDGKSGEEDIVDVLFNKRKDYDVFYTSCYEIDQNNYKKISELIDYYGVAEKKTFLDLSPLVYTIPKKIWESVLKNLKYIMGTIEEFDLLFNVMEIEGFKYLMEMTKIDKIYIKRGSNGCSVVERGSEELFFETEPIKTDNLTGCGDAFNAGVIIGEVKKLKTSEIADYSMNLASDVIRK
jgi:sugar/nucleoside kinase (ribokinase family)